MSTDPSFDEFARGAEAELRRAYAGNMAPEVVSDAIAEALAYAWEHRRRMRRLSNPIGYLYRVGQSKTRRRKEGFLVWPTDDAAPHCEPGLSAALAKLSGSQSSAIWLVKACGWTNVQAGEALDVSPSTVATHVTRGMERLRHELGATDA